MVAVVTAICILTVQTPKKHEALRRNASCFLGHTIEAALCAASIRLGFIAIATCIRTNQNPNSVRRREAPPHTIWVLSLLMPNYLQINSPTSKLLSCRPDCH